jgi:DeoR family transcriptional regulator of aga operon
MATTIERRQQIIQFVNEHGKVMVEDLAKLFHTSTVTIRNDLNALDKKGMLVRVRGGAMESNRLTQELTIKEKHSENVSVKRKIGEFAASLVQPDEALIIDSGTTTEEMARCLHSGGPLIVMTNGLNITGELSKFDNVDVMMTGGNLRKKSQSFYGRQAEDNLRHLRFDKLFLGVDGFDLKSGITTHFDAEASLNRVMCDVSSEIIVLADSSKFAKYGFHIIRPYHHISRLITDENIPQAYKEALESKGVIVDIVTN